MDLQMSHVLDFLANHHVSETITTSQAHKPINDNHR